MYGLSSWQKCPFSRFFTTIVSKKVELFSKATLECWDLLTDLSEMRKSNMPTEVIRVLEDATEEASSCQFL